MDSSGIAFPFHVDELGKVASSSGDEHLRARIVQVLLTAPGERVMTPEFGCGLRDLVFAPNDDVLSATAEFAISRALQRWLGDEIVVEAVDVAGEEGSLEVHVTYARRDSLERGQVRIAF